MCGSLLRLTRPRHDSAQTYSQMPNPTWASAKTHGIILAMSLDAVSGPRRIIDLWATGLDASEPEDTTGERMIAMGLKSRSTKRTSGLSLGGMSAVGTEQAERMDLFQTALLEKIQDLNSHWLERARSETFP